MKVLNSGRVNLPAKVLRDRGLSGAGTSIPAKLSHSHYGDDVGRYSGHCCQGYPGAGCHLGDLQGGWHLSETREHTLENTTIHRSDEQQVGGRFGHTHTYSGAYIKVQAGGQEWNQ